MSDKAKNVVSYYVLCNKLKDIVRTGWKDWKVERDRVESIAEHVFGVSSLAIAMWSQYESDVDIMKVLFMLTIHESEEIYIGDLTQFQISREEKKKLGETAVSELLKDLLKKEEIKSLIDEFDARESKEAKFAYQCDKLECDIQCKLYDEEGCVDLSKQDDNLSFKHPDVQRHLASSGTWSGAWMAFGRERYNYDSNFTEVSEYAENNPISLVKKSKV